MEGLVETFRTEFQKAMREAHTPRRGRLQRDLLRPDAVRAQRASRQRNGDCRALGVRGFTALWEWRRLDLSVEALDSSSAR
jgi:hypothetical protein